MSVGQNRAKRYSWKQSLLSSAIALFAYQLDPTGRVAMKGSRMSEVKNYLDLLPFEKSRLCEVDCGCSQVFRLVGVGLDIA